MRKKLDTIDFQTPLDTDDLMAQARSAIAGHVRDMMFKNCMYLIDTTTGMAHIYSKETC